MSSTTGSTASSASSGQGDRPLSLDDLFNAEVAGASSQTPDEELDSFVESEDEPDDVDTAGELNLPENDPEDGSEPDEDDAEGEELEEDQVDGHLPFAPTSASAASADEAEQDDAADLKPEDVTFADLGLPADLLKAVTDMGYVTPTAIQREAIPVLLSGRDVVGVAQTGTGKTAAFGLPLLDAVDARDGEVQALVLAPTRELALQSAEAITDMASRSRGLDVVAVYGGAPYGPQIGALKSGAQVVVGTPGRVIDLIDKGALHLGAVRYFVLDEADEMLRMGFAEDVETIAASLPAERRTALFSATMPPAIQAVARQHLSDPARVEVSRQSSTVDTVHQTYAVVPFRHKVGAVSRVLATTEAEAAIVFVRTKSTAEDVAIELAGRGIQAAAISGDVPQRERERLVERLRSGTLDVLVATDVAARGLDVDRIGLVVNFDVPREAEAYVHRIGRTGRAGRHGEAVTFLTPKEKGKLRQIERLTGTRLEEITLPSPADVSRHRAASSDSTRLTSSHRLTSARAGSTTPERTTPSVASHSLRAARRWARRAPARARARPKTQATSPSTTPPTSSTAGQGTRPQRGGCRSIRSSMRSRCVSPSHAPPARAVQTKAHCRTLAADHHRGVRGAMSGVRLTATSRSSRSASARSSPWLTISSRAGSGRWEASAADHCRAAVRRRPLAAGRTGGKELRPMTSLLGVTPRGWPVGCPALPALRCRPRSGSLRSRATHRSGGQPT